MKADLIKRLEKYRGYLEKRSTLQKAVLISVAAMAVAFAILTFVFHRLEGVKFEEGFLRVSAQADDPAATVYAGKVQGEPGEDHRDGLLR